MLSQQEVPCRGVHGQQGPKLLALECICQHAEEHPQGALASVCLRLTPHSAQTRQNFKLQVHFDFDRTLPISEIILLLAPP